MSYIRVSYIRVSYIIRCKAALCKGVDIHVRVRSQIRYQIFGQVINRRGKKFTLNRVKDLESGLHTQFF